MMNIKALTVFFCGFAFLVSCDVFNSGPSLKGGSWRVVSVRDASGEVIFEPHHGEIYDVTFHKDARPSGQDPQKEINLSSKEQGAGCAGFFETSFNILVVTVHACTGANRRYLVLETLEGGSSFDIRDNSLEIETTDWNGNEVMIELRHQKGNQ